MTAEEILKKHIQMDFNILDFPEYKGNMYINAMEEYTALKLAEVKEDKWVSVKDRLPKHDQEVLFYNEHGIVMDYFNSYNAAYYKRSFTHWMELPNNPK